MSHSAEVKVSDKVGWWIVVGFCMNQYTTSIVDVFFVVCFFSVIRKEINSMKGAKFLDIYVKLLVTKIGDSKWPCLDFYLENHLFLVWKGNIHVFTTKNVINHGNLRGPDVNATPPPPHIGLIRAGVALGRLGDALMSCRWSLIQPLGCWKLVLRNKWWSLSLKKKSTLLTFIYLI